MLQKTETFSPADGHFFLLYLLQLIYAIAYVHPASCAWIFNDRVSWILLRGHFVDRLSITLQDLTSVPCTNSTRKHRGMGTNGDVADRKKVMFWVIVGIDVDLASGDENERGIDVNGKLNVSIFITIQLEFRLFLSRLVKSLIFLLLVLYFFLYDLVNLAKPFSACQHFSLPQL